MYKFVFLFSISQALKHVLVTCYIWRIILSFFCCSFFPLSCAGLPFTEIVNQLNALSCLHGDDDDDDGFPKRARKAKPAASSQGLFLLSFNSIISHPNSTNVQFHLFSTNGYLQPSTFLFPPLPVFTPVHPVVL